MMLKSTTKMLIELFIMLAMLFGWLGMLYSGFRSGLSEVSHFNSLRYGFYVFLIAASSLALFSRRRIFNERLSIGMIIFGLLSLCQPFTIVLYRCGFQTLLVGTLAFIIISHTK